MYSGLYLNLRRKGVGFPLQKRISVAYFTFLDVGDGISAIGSNCLELISIKLLKSTDFLGGIFVPLDFPSIL